MRGFKRVFFIAIAFCCACGGHCAEDSLQTLADEAAARADKILNLEPKTYFLDKPLKLDSRHSGLCLRGCKGTVISSGRKIDGWKKDGNFWRVELKGEKFVSSLFVNGARARVASEPDEGFKYFVFRGTNMRRGDNLRTFIVRFEDVKDILKIPHCELKNAYFQIYRAWIDNKAFVSQLRQIKGTQTCAVTFSRDISPHIYGGEYSLPRYKISNYKGALDTAGEFYFDTNTQVLWYAPRESDDIDTASAFYPVSDKLLEIAEENGGEFVSDVSIENIEFEYASARPDSDGWRASNQAASEMPSAIRICDAKNLRFYGCKFFKLDGYAAEFFSNSWHCRIENCIFGNLGAGAIRIGNPRGLGNGEVSKIAVKNNIVYNYGRIDRSGVGIIVFNCGNIEILNNEIFDGYYTGISVGWTWGFAPTKTQNNNISANKIHNLSFGQMCDLGGIYTLGGSEGSRICGNRIYAIDCHQYGGWGIYNDEGSSGFLVSSNFVSDAQEGGYYMHYGRDCNIVNNVFCNSRDFQIGLGRRGKEEDNSFTFTRNVVIYSAPAKLFRDNFPPPQRAVHFNFNAYYNTCGEVYFGSHSFGEWQKSGRDVFSISEKIDAEALLNGAAIAKIGFEPIEAKNAGVRAEMKIESEKILESYAYEKIVRYPTKPDWDNGFYDDFSVGVIGKPPVYMNLEGAENTARVVAAPALESGRALLLEAGAKVSGYCRFAKPKCLLLSFKFKINKDSTFSVGTERGNFFSVVGGNIKTENGIDELPANVWIEAAAEIVAPLKYGELFPLKLRAKGFEKSFEMRLGKGIYGNPKRAVFASKAGVVEISEISLSAK